MLRENGWLSPLQADNTQSEAEQIQQRIFEKRKLAQLKVRKIELH